MKRMFDLEEVREMIDEKIEWLDKTYEQAEESGDNTQFDSCRFRKMHGTISAWECLADFIDEISENYDDTYDKGFNDGYKLGFVNGKKLAERNEIRGKYL